MVEVEAFENWEEWLGWRPKRLVRNDEWVKVDGVKSFGEVNAIGSISDGCFQLTTRSP